ncbi:hypothetical protein [Pseudomonas sp. FG-3G]|nr:hypothetical protein [Pseudomonas sp. FG-3G]
MFYGFTVRLVGAPFFLPGFYRTALDERWICGEGIIPAGARSGPET